MYVSIFIPKYNETLLTWKKKKINKQETFYTILFLRILNNS